MSASDNVSRDLVSNAAALYQHNNGTPGIPPSAHFKVDGRANGELVARVGYKRGGSKLKNQNLTEKKLRRLEKNRLSARACRRRKREAAQDMEREILKLEDDNMNLRLQLQIGEEAEASSCKEREEFMEGVDQLLKDGVPETKIYSTIQEFKKKYSFYGKDKRSAIHFHLSNVARLLMPTNTTTFALQALKLNQLNGEGDPVDKAISNDRPSDAVTSSKQNEALSYLETIVQTKPEAASTTSDATLMKCSVSTKPGISKEDLVPTKLEISEENPVPTKLEISEENIVPTKLDVRGENTVPTKLDVNGENTVPTRLEMGQENLVPTKLERNEENPELIKLKTKAVFKHLVEHLDVTPQQAAVLKDSRYVSEELDNALAESLALLAELKKCFTQVGEELESEFDRVYGILTPSQTAKFLVWIKNNGSCMYMLEELWRKVYMKPIETDQKENGTN